MDASCCLIHPGALVSRYNIANFCYITRAWEEAAELHVAFVFYHDGSFRKSVKNEQASSLHAEQSGCERYSYDFLRLTLIEESERCLVGVKSFRKKWDRRLPLTFKLLAEFPGVSLGTYEEAFRYPPRLRSDIVLCERGSSVCTLYDVYVGRSNHILKLGEDILITGILRIFRNGESVISFPLSHQFQLHESYLTEPDTVMTVQCMGPDGNTCEMVVVAVNPAVSIELPDDILTLTAFSAAKPRSTKNQKLELCSVCLDRRRDATIVHGDTGHIVCCFDCAVEVKSGSKLCPVCRQPIDRVVRNFVP